MGFMSRKKADETKDFFLEILINPNDFKSTTVKSLYNLITQELSKEKPDINNYKKDIDFLSASVNNSIEHGNYRAAIEAIVVLYTAGCSKYTHAKIRDLAGKLSEKGIEIGLSLRVK